MSIDELITQLEEIKTRDFIQKDPVYIDIGEGWDSLSSVRIESNVVILVPLGQDSA